MAQAHYFGKCQHNHQGFGWAWIMNDNQVAVRHSLVFKFTAGILLCGKIRDYLERRQFEGLKIKWREGQGWIDREWVIVGDRKDVNSVFVEISNWADANNLCSKK